MNQRFPRAALLAASLLLSLALGACSMLGSREPVGGGASGKDATQCPTAEHLQAAVDSDYGQHLMARFSKLVVYPPEAVDAGQFGQLGLCARLSRDGKIHDARIAAGSGYPVLDGAALMALGQLTLATEAEPMPRDFAKGQDSVWLSIPVDFQPPANSNVHYTRAPEDRPCKDTGSKEGDIEAQQISLKEWGDFPGIFSDAVKQELIYPAAAIEAKQGGYTLLCVSLDRDSHLLGASISRSSGYPLLDAASLMALGLVQIKAHMPPVPDRVRQAHDRTTFTQEISWKPTQTLTPQ
jgi:TonB family protein